MNKEKVEKTIQSLTNATRLAKIHGSASALETIKADELFLLLEDAIKAIHKLDSDKINPTDALIRVIGERDRLLVEKLRLEEEQNKLTADETAYLDFLFQRSRSRQPLPLADLSRL